MEKSQKIQHSDIEWHFIGHLQSNKASLLLGLQPLMPAVRNLSVVESIDSLKLATKLNTLWSSRPNPLRIFVQVNTSGEGSKSGVPPEKTVEFVTKIVQDLHKLEFVGLMSIGSPEQNDFSDFKVRGTCDFFYCLYQDHYLVFNSQNCSKQPSFC